MAATAGAACALIEAHWEYTPGRCDVTVMRGLWMLLLLVGFGTYCPAHGEKPPVKAAFDLAPGEVGETPLMLAARTGPANSVKALLRRGANPLRRSPTGRTALHYAVQGDELEVVELLLKARPYEQLRGSSEVSPLALALRLPDPKIALLLLSRLREPTSEFPAVCAWGGLDMVNSLLARGVSISPSCLVMAAGRGWEPALDVWDKIVEPRSYDAEAMAIVERLLAAGVSLDLVGSDALSVACAAFNSRTARLLLARGVDPRRADHNGDYPILRAVEQGEAELVRSLLVAGADPAVRDYRGRGAEQRLEARMAALGSSVESYGRMCCVHPGLERAHAELERLQSVRAEILRLFGK